MEKISIFRSLKAGWSHFVLRPWYLFGLTMAVIIIMMFVTGNAMMTALTSIIYGGYLILLFKHSAGEKVEFDDLFTIDRRWISLAAVLILKTLLVGLGFLLFILPGIYLAIRWMFAEYLVIDQNMTPVQALRASSELTKGYWWKLFGFSLVSVLLVFLGTLVFLVGLFVVILVVTLATIHLYHQLRAIKETRTESLELSNESE